MNPYVHPNNILLENDRAILAKLPNIGIWIIFPKDGSPDSLRYSESEAIARFREF